MGKFYGAIGFGITQETTPGVWVNNFIEHNMYGDILKNVSKNVNTNQLNDDITISNIISIIADPYATQNFHLIKYCKFMGTKWKVLNVEVQYPRLLLTLGGVYNG